MIDRRRRTIGARGGGGWLPTDGAGLLSWHDPNNTSSVSEPVGDPVQNFLDLTANNIDFTQGTLANRPVLRQTNSVKWIEGDGVDDYMDLGGLMDFSAVSLFGLMRSDDTGENHLLASFSVGGDNNDQIRTYQNDFQIIANGGVPLNSVNPITTGQWHVLSFLGTYGGASSIRVDGVEVGTAAPFTGLNLGRLGGRFGTSYLGGIGETVSYLSSALTSETLANVEAYLGAFATTLNA